MHACKQVDGISTLDHCIAILLEILTNIPYKGLILL